MGLLVVALMLAVLPVAQLSHPPSRSGWLADDVILGVSFTSLSVKTQTSIRCINKYNNLVSFAPYH